MTIINFQRNQSFDSFESVIIQIYLYFKNKPENDRENIYVVLNSETYFKCYPRKFFF